MKFDTLSNLDLKFNYIETVLSWKGEIYAGEVAEYFNVTRQTAQGYIKAYRKAFPGQMEYIPSCRRHVRSETFRPVLLTKATPKDGLFFLDFIRGQTLVGRYWNSDVVSEVPLIDANRYGRPEVSINIVQAILAGLTNRKRVSVLYQSKRTNPETVDRRMISPNRLVYADNRYHVRAYCHKWNIHLDFVLSRFHDAKVENYENPGSKWVSGDKDTAWRTKLLLRFKPNPKLNSAQVQAITIGMKLDQNGFCCIETNEAIAYYVERRMQAIDRKLKCELWILHDKKIKE